MGRPGGGKAEPRKGHGTDWGANRTLGRAQGGIMPEPANRGATKKGITGRDVLTYAN